VASYELGQGEGGKGVHQAVEKTPAWTAWKHIIIDQGFLR
jgi:hypothetical protein